MPREQYRIGVCIVLTRDGGRHVLVCHRIDSPQGAGWQFPQGGVDPDADLIEEAKRELREEIGTDGITVLAVTRERFCYDFPDGVTKNEYHGQCHRWVLAELVCGDSAIHFRNEPVEFDAFEWVTPEEAFRRVVDFKKAAYRKALNTLGVLREPA